MNTFKQVFAAIALIAGCGALPAMAQNLVVNGNFTDPNATNSNRYFSSDYSRHGYPGGASAVHGTGPGFFELGSDPKLDNQTWTTSGARDNPGGQFLLVDGSTKGSNDGGATSELDGTARVWFEQLNVVGGQDYALSAYAEAFDAANPADLDFTITGGGHSQTRGGLQLESSQVGVWRNLNGTWTAPTTETVTFAIVDKQTAQSGNDFGLDDISFKPVPEATTVLTFGLLLFGGILFLRKRSRDTYSSL